MKTKFIAAAIAVLALTGCSQQNAVEKKEPRKEIPDAPTDQQESTQQRQTQKSPAQSINNNTPMTSDMHYVEQYSGAVLHTSLGDITLSFYNSDSPVTVNNFLKLASEKFYDGTRFHRVIKDFMIQGGDPNSKDEDWSNDGMGDPGYKFKDEFNRHALVRGSIAMANSGPNTNGSQFFIVTAASTPWLDGKHTNFGEVTSGMEVIDKIENAKTNQNDHPLENITVTSIDLIEKK